MLQHVCLIRISRLQIVPCSLMSPLKEIPGASTYARKLVVGSLHSVFSLFFDDFNIHKIIKSTEIKARSKLEYGSWTVDKE